MYLKKRLFAGLLELALLCTLFSGCAARKAERYDVLASTAAGSCHDGSTAGWYGLKLRAGRDGKRLVPA